MHHFMLSWGRQGQRARFASRDPYLNSDSAWEQGGRDAIDAAFAVRERAHICYHVSRQLGPYRATPLESKSPSHRPPPRRGLALARGFGSRVPLARGPWIGERLLDDPASKGRPVPIRLYFGPLLFLDQFSDLILSPGSSDDCRPHGPRRLPLRNCRRLSDPGERP